MSNDSGQRLTDKQRRFIDEYLVDLNASRAALRAGYSPRTADRTGHENLNKPEIRAAIDAALSERSARTQVAADDVIKGLLEEARFRGKGCSHAARVNAWTQLGKHLAMFTDRHEHKGQFQHTFSELSDDDLERELAEAQRALSGPAEGEAEAADRGGEGGEEGGG